MGYNFRFDPKARHGDIALLRQAIHPILLPTGSEERGVLGVRSIPVIPPSSQDMTTMALI